MSNFKQKIINITYNKKKYSVIEVNYKGNRIPVVVDNEYINIIIKSCIKIKCDNMCNITCSINKQKKKLSELLFESDLKHINGFGLDNRRENLDFLNHQKKILPKNITNIPMYMWYICSDKTHGDRFMIKIKDYKWVTTSSKNISTVTKFEEAKKHMLILRKTNPELFIDTVLCDSEIKKKKKILNSFFKIIYKAGYTNIKKLKMDKNGNIINNYNLTKQEKIILKNLKKTSISKIPKQSRLNINILPKYVYYRKQYKNRGSHFVIENHPEINKVWRTTTSLKVSDVDKYNEMIEFYNSLHKI